MLCEAYRACLFTATGGVEAYDRLWGVGLMHACDVINRSIWSDGRCPYATLTGGMYKWDKHDHVFGANAYYHVPKEHRKSKFHTVGKQCIWVSNSQDSIDSSLVIPIKWDPELNAWQLSKPIIATNVVVEDDKLPLRDGPGISLDNEELKIFQEKCPIIFIRKS